MPGGKGSGLEHSDKRSESSSQQSTDDSRHHREDSPQSKHGGETKHSEASSQQSIDDFRDNKEHSPRSKHGGEAKHSEASSERSIDDFRHHKDRSAQPKHYENSSEQSIDDFRHHNEHSTQPKHGGEASQNFTEDFELLGFGEEDSGERLSDISDGDLSMGTETEGSMASLMEFTLFPEVTKPTESTKAGNTELQKTQAENARGEKTPSQRTVRFAPSKLPKPSPRLLETKATRTSLIKVPRSFVKYAPNPSVCPWQSTAGSSSSVKPGKRWH
ncbi:unnamed protein product [Prunus armeniaca]|uniref:Uncharacterized protein n=1 Tax=Prunus armeniaca TaxID=36596 RepID=A0A6J5XBR0_PRUAR|nr:unnamed protein product [Prunus armeniaca]